VRGTGHLENGQATVSLPDHFLAVAGDQGVTVQLTPLSAESKGLAVTEKSSERFVVKELNGGSGSYDFDFMVTAVRRGFENYEVVKLKMERATVAATAGGERAVRHETKARSLKGGF
jgi:hypothetical protein